MAEIDRVVKIDNINKIDRMDFVDEIDKIDEVDEIILAPFWSHFGLCLLLFRSHFVPILFLFGPF